MAGGTPPPRRWPALDGLRGLAVLAVVAYHGGVPGFGAGFLGVDVFFVLSGFLITRLLIEEAGADGGIRLGAFWARRARRLLPALAVVLAFVLVTARDLVPPGGLAALRSDILATVAYVPNWHFILSGQGYFGSMGAPSPLLHTWSLGLEEQFYVLWPLLLIGLLRTGHRRRYLIGAAAGLALASGLEMALLSLTGASPSRLYFGTDTRAQPLMVGVLLGLVWTAGRRSASEADGGVAPAQVAGDVTSVGRTRVLVIRMTAVGALGVLAGAVAWVGPTSRLLYQGGFLAVAVVTALLMASVLADPAGPVGRLLSNPALRWFGTISYELYLWHWPLDLLLSSGRTGLAGADLFLARSGAAVLAASLTYYLVSRPVRLAPGRSPALAVAGGVVLGGVVLAGLFGLVLGGTRPAAASGPGSTGKPVTASESGAGAGATMASGPDPRILFVGDSVSFTLAAGLYAVQSGYGVRIDNQATVGCGVMGDPVVRFLGVVQQHPGGCPGPPEWRNLARASQPGLVVLMIGRWETTDQRSDGVWQHIGQPAFDARLRSDLTSAIRALSSTGAPVELMDAPCFGGPEQPGGSAWPENTPSRVSEFNRLLDQVAQSLPGRPAPAYDIGRRLCPSGTFTYTVDHRLVRETDGVHITPAGAALVAPDLLPRLRALAGR